MCKEFFYTRSREMYNEQPWIEIHSVHESQHAPRAKPISSSSSTHPQRSCSLPKFTAQPLSN